MLKDCARYIGLGPIGVLEIILSLVIILSRYNLFGIPFSFITVVIMIIIALARGAKFHFSSNKALTLLLIYWTFHDLIWILISKDTPQYFFNQRLVLYTIFLSLFILYRAIDKDKLYNSINWIAIISIIGMLYHYLQIFSGKFIQPLNILPLNVNRAEAYEVLSRPTSFYSEPQAFVSFMMIPLFLSLTQKKYIWSLIISISILLSTSSTGILVVGLIYLTYIISSKMNFWKRMSFFITIICIAVAYINLDYFREGREKIETQDYSTNIRLQTGLVAFQEMDPIYYFFGVPHTVPIEYVKEVGLDLMGGGFDLYNNYVFLPTFWGLLIMFGIVGLILFLNVYYKFYKINKDLLPLLMCLLVLMFSNSDLISINDLFYITFIFVFVSKNKKIVT